MRPDLEKTYDGDPTIETLWRELANALARAKRVFVLGHSLHDEALVQTLRDNIASPELLAVTVYDNPEEPTDASDVAERVTAELPGAHTLPFRFEANREFISQPLSAWLGG
jgi:hypothetical protein